MSIPLLVKSLKIDEQFLNDLSDRGLISPNNLQKLKKKHDISSKAFPFKLLEEIDRLPDAFSKFCIFLCDSDQIDAAKILKGERSISGSSSRTTSLSDEACSSSLLTSNDTTLILETEESYEENEGADGLTKKLKTLMTKKTPKIKDRSSITIIPGEVFESLEVQVIKGNKEYQDKGTYKLSPGIRRGKAMIINFETFKGTDYKTREGSQKDVLNMRALLSQLGNYHSNSNISRNKNSVLFQGLMSQLYQLKIWEVENLGRQ